MKDEQFEDFEVELNSPHPTPHRHVDAYTFEHLRLAWRESDRQATQRERKRIVGFLRECEKDEKVNISVRDLSKYIADRIESEGI